MQNSKHILFLSNSGSRGGANVVLLALAKHMAASTDLKPIILFRTHDEFINEFKQYGEVLVQDFEPKVPKSIFNRLRKKIRQVLDFTDLSIYNTLKILKSKNIQLIYSNTVHNEKAIQYIKSALNVPLIIHSHEQDYILNMYKKQRTFRDQFDKANHFITVCKASEAALKSHFNIPKEKISLIYPGIDVTKSNNFNKLELRKKFGINQNDFVVIAMGNPHWIKGCDLFLQVAISTIKQDARIKFYWIGGNNRNESYNQLKNDIKKSGYGNNIIQVEHTTNPFIYHAISDLFILTSRVDSFPLVNLQSGLFKVPVICFNNSGGSVELINEDTGAAVPYGDTEEMAKQVLKLKNEPLLLENKGTYLHDRVVKNFNEIDSIKQIVEVINNLI